MKNVNFTQIITTKEGAGFVAHIIKSFIPYRKATLASSETPLRCSISKRQLVSKEQIIDAVMASDNKRKAVWLAKVVNGNFKEIQDILPEIGINKKDVAVSSKTSKEILAFPILEQLAEFTENNAIASSSSYIQKVCKEKINMSLVSIKIGKTMMSNVQFKAETSHKS